MNYVEKVREQLKKRIEDYPEWGERKEELLDLYALLTITKGRETTMEDIHDAWSLWTNREDPTHQSLVPFIQLAPDIAAYDRPYMEAVHDVADWIEGQRDKSYRIIWNLNPFDPSERVGSVEEAIALVFKREEFEGRRLKDSEYDLAEVRRRGTKEMMQLWSDEHGWSFHGYVERERRSR